MNRSILQDIISEIMALGESLRNRDLTPEKQARLAADYQDLAHVHREVLAVRYSKWRKDDGSA